MADITKYFETADEILALAPESLAGFLLEHVETARQSDPRNSTRSFSLHEIAYWITEQYAQKGFGRTKDLSRAIAEAWNWLVVEGLLALDPNGSRDGHCFVTRRGREGGTHGAVEEYRRRRLFSGDLLHETIRECAFPDYMSGDYESAILKAFRKIEIEVRNATSTPPGVTAVPMMRQVFHAAPNVGPLTDTTELPGEQEAMSHMFAGALGRYRNPTSHGTRAFADPIEAAELLILASHLMTIVDVRRPAGNE